MKSRRTVVVLSLLLAAWALTRPGDAAADTPAPMNVLFIISDDLRNEMGCYGVERASTPRLDELAESSVRFDRAYCQYPLCNPSRSSMLTGLYPTTVGVLGNRTWFGATRPDAVSLPRWFRQNGYHTLSAGKIFHGGIDDVEAWDEGGSARYFGEGATRRPPPSIRPDRAAGGRRLTKQQRSDRWIVLEGDEEKTGDHRVATRAIEMLRSAASDEQQQPFFLACGFSKPHSPLAAPKRFFDMWDLGEIELPIDFAARPTVPEGFPAGSIRPRNADLFIGREASEEEAKMMTRAYLASTAWMDWNAGRVLDTLDELGLGENTIVVFWGDHGYQLGEKGKWSKAGSLWEQGARVPLFIRDPRKAGNGTPCPRVVETIDLYPTLCDLCGVDRPAGLEGESLATLLDDPTHEDDSPAFTVWSGDGEHITGVCVRTERWRYAEFYGRGPGAMLTDPVSDPHELVNLVNDPEHADTVGRLSKIAREHVAGHTPAAAP
ncbi:Choline-sulfatase [Pseudobythopirellula maris]|uniref:Choline-sulfatase n=1 Tax=Pseudobythopirellula maris TaxID=2527991 RepID=A0A5C5ZTK8_9BACT|nr:sulfatase [Pseudobythopirellula maris]TWT90852.1 Choline-sulfatase [Pseudobythopirellula maris]